jgi:DNA-binding SARP family transcriptional activator
MLAVDAHPGSPERASKLDSNCPEKPIFTLRLLGGFELLADGHEVRVPDATQKIIAFLAFQTAAVRRGFVAGSLWTDHSDERASANLRTALWRLPREVSGLVVGGRTTLGLSTLVSIDYRNALRIALSLLVGENERFVAPGSEFEALDNTLLPGWYDDWVVAERDRLQQIRLHVLEVLARNALNQGHFEDSIHLAQTVLRAEPLRESGHMLLARAHIASGNRASAVRQIQRLDALLLSELGISASPEAWLIIEHLHSSPPGRKPLPSGVRR